MRKISRMLRCDYTAEELDTKRDALSNATLEIGGVEENKASANRAFKERLDGLYAETAKLAYQIKARHELRPTECVVEMNKPHVGEKTIIRTDTGELVSIEVMTEDERQEEFEFNQDASGQVDKLIEDAHKEPPDEAQPAGD